MEYRESRVHIDSPMEIDEFGTLTAKARIARIGVQTYMIDGKRVRELRPSDEVEASAATFEAKPISLNHPLQKVVTSDTARDLMKGFVTDLAIENGWMTATTHVTHQDAVEAAQTTHNMFSNGYMADIEMLDSPAIWVDDLGVMGDVGALYEYDAIQRNIRGNHVALVRNPRAGSGATFVSDELEDVITIDTTRQIIDKDITMTKVDSEKTIKVRTITVDGSDYEISGENSKEVVDLVSTLQGKVDGLSCQLDEANEEITTLKSTKVADSVIAQEVADRTAIWALVSPHIDSDVDYSLPVSGVKKLYLKTVLPHLSAKIDAGDDKYLAGIWDIKQPTEVKSDGAANLTDEALGDITTPHVVADSKGSHQKVAKSDDMSQLKKNFEDARKNYFNKK